MADKKKINRIKVVLAELDVSQKELADKWGKTTSYLSRICQNHTQPTLEDLALIADLLDVDIRDLLNSTKP